MKSAQALLACVLFLSCQPDEKVVLSGKKFALSFSPLAEFSEGDFISIDNHVVFHVHDFSHQDASGDTIFVPTTLFVQSRNNKREFKSKISPLSILGIVRRSLNKDPRYWVSSENLLLTNGVLIIEAKAGELVVSTKPGYPLHVSPLE